ncbi:B12-binding domain-containing radical SAM protein [Polynucleobacter sphagniphilus]|uniref:B12-binding domain-containing radical SAM protein n=1 Tax=Polynucleobacter sphagniphilus TaxID=1743169 RepID=UPI00096BCB06|nr:radical SAM protein [Polynucleobacter sphagniphilus]OLY97340.1 radical SAM protein [Polynucleobacter sphagniphilus]
MKVLSLIPPMTQLNTPYPSTAYLTGFLRSRKINAVQEDLALALVLDFFTPAGLAQIRAQALSLPEQERSASVHFFLDYFEDYQSTIAPVIAFLQGRDSTLSHRINSRDFLPEGPRFTVIDAFDDDSGDSLAWAFGALGSQDRARHFATLYLNDLSDVLHDAVDDRFEFVRYAESLASSQPSFEPLAQALAAKPTLMDEYLRRLTIEALDKHQPSLVLLSVPFPGAMYAALRIAQTIKASYPTIKIGLGGGYVNTELRELDEPRIFNFVDFITLDSGERPLLSLLEHLAGKRSADRLVRTFIRNEQNQVEYKNWPEPDIPFEDVGTATWDGLPLDSYLSLLDMLNPMHRLWSDGRWNKLTVAHGCYWKKCSFCDVSLDYISRYETASASLLVDRIEAIIAETGQTGFHFVDEAAPPKILKALAEELLRRKVLISWWGNIRFEKTFTPELAQLLAKSGCIAMSGGLEVASDRLLKLMKKGVSVNQVAQVTKSFSDAGILVHAYLMYGFPTQTVQETVDSLEYVRQLFANGCIQSGFFHRFSCTVHSPVGLNPQEYGIKLIPLPPVSFAKNDIGFIDPSGVDHVALGLGLKKAIYNFMHGIGLDEDIRAWFDILVPKPSVSRQQIVKALRM